MLKQISNNLLALNASHVESLPIPIASDFLSRSALNIPEDAFNKNIGGLYIRESDVQHIKNVAEWEKRFNAIINNAKIDQIKKNKSVWLLGFNLRKDYFEGTVTLKTHNVIVNLINRYLNKNSPAIHKISAPAITFFSNEKTKYCRGKIEPYSNLEEINRSIIIEDQEIDPEKARQAVLKAIELAREEYAFYIDPILANNFITSIRIFSKKAMCLLSQRDPNTPDFQLPSAAFSPCSNPNSKQEETCLIIFSGSLHQNNLKRLARILIHELRHALWMNIYRKETQQYLNAPYYPNKLKVQLEYERLFEMGVNRILKFEQLLDKETILLESNNYEELALLNQYKTLAKTLESLTFRVKIKGNYEVGKVYKIDNTAIDGINYGYAKILQIAYQEPVQELQIEMLDYNQALIANVKIMAGFVMPERYNAVSRYNYRPLSYLAESDAVRYHMLSCEINDFIFPELNVFQQKMIDRLLQKADEPLVNPNTNNR